ncbi:MAG: hypothetical protein K2I87_07960, partial [Bacteroidales bacterium]|nr:hypothetical protein [Bacteroidales bacterium]
MSFRFNKIRTSLALVGPLLAVSCIIPSPEKPATVHYVEWRQPPYFPTATNISASNRLTSE